MADRISIRDDPDFFTKLVDKEFCERFNAVPVSIDDNNLFVIASDVVTREKREAMEICLEYKCHVSLIPVKQKYIDKIMDKYYK